MVRILATNGEVREKRTDAAATADRVSLRTALLGLGVFAAGYVVGRGLQRGDTLSTGDVRERVGEALPGDGVDVPIVGADETEAGEVTPVEMDSDVEGDGSMATGVDPSLEEVDERTRPDLEDGPIESEATEGTATPGRESGDHPEADDDEAIADEGTEDAHED